VTRITTGAALCVLGLLSVVTLSACTPGLSTSSGASDPRPRVEAVSDFTDVATDVSDQFQTQLTDMRNQVINIQAAIKSWPNEGNMQCYLQLQVSIGQQFQDLVSLRPQIQTMVANETSDSDAEATLINQMQSSLDALKKTMDGNNKTFIACGGNSDFLSEGGAPFPG